MPLVLSRETAKFISTLQKPTQAKWVRNLNLLSQYGNKLGMPHVKRITNNLSELRIRGKQEVRAFFTCIYGTIFVMHAFIKKTNKIPSREIKTALKRIAEVLAND